MLVVAVTYPSSAKAGNPDNAEALSLEADALLLDAEQAARSLGLQLKTELQAAMGAGGPGGAIAVCQDRAPALAAAVSRETGFSVSRVSLKPRNPVMGPPNDWQREVLASFDRRQRAGESPASFTWHAVSGDEFRFMQAIPTGGVCLACHGSRISPEVSEALGARYPGDAATGYAAGEVRGAFVVTRQLGQPIGTQ